MESPLSFERLTPSRSCIPSRNNAASGCSLRLKKKRVTGYICLSVPTGTFWNPVHPALPVPFVVTSESTLLHSHPQPPTSLCTAWPCPTLMIHPSLAGLLALPLLSETVCTCQLTERKKKILALTAEPCPGNRHGKQVADAAHAHRHTVFSLAWMVVYV